jgi:radical SAM superfamily enzyme YgiQ (UPF0313 family)
MKIDIIIVYVNRYIYGHEKHFVSPITGIHLAALTPAKHIINVIHQQIQDVNLETDADVIALSFFSGFAPEAYLLAKEFRKRGKIVIAGGPHATFHPDEVLRYCDIVITGEAESVWEQVLNDIENKQAKSRYFGTPKSLSGIPTPRYDLLSQVFFIPRVVQATRGCPFSCSFCTVPTLNPGYRTRPVDEVIRDIRYDNFKHWWQRKIVWFWDDNLTCKRDYIKKLLTAMIPLKKWWLTQASMDIAKDEILLKLMKASGCIGIFFGIESFQSSSLDDAKKHQNKVNEYKSQIQALHRKGICVMAGFIAGFDGDTRESIVLMAKHLYDIGVDVPFLSILTPYRGTDVYERFLAESRILHNRGWEFYNGYNVTFSPKNMSPELLEEAHRKLWREAFSIRYCLKRIIRSMFKLRLGAFVMCTFMNLFYCIKALRGNIPKSYLEENPYLDTTKDMLDKMHTVNCSLLNK